MGASLDPTNGEVHIAVTVDGVVISLGWMRTR
jgi:hypothetical protein